MQQRHRDLAPGWRRCAALIGFLDQQLVAAIFAANPYQLDGRSGQSLNEAWSLCNRSVSELSRTVANADISDVPRHLEARVQEVRSGTEYREAYSQTAEYNFGFAPISCLLTPQFIADLDYVDEIKAAVPRDMGPESLFDFVFQAGEIAIEPIKCGNQVIFSTHKRDFDCDATPAIRRSDQRTFEICVRVFSRPNFVQVAVLDDRLILANGVHKVLALAELGVARIPCLWRRIQDISELGLSQTSSDVICRQLCRDPLRSSFVSDFLDPELAAPVLVRSMDLVMRVSLQSEFMLVPSA